MFLSVSSGFNVATRQKTTIFVLFLEKALMPLIISAETMIDNSEPQQQGVELVSMSFHTEFDYDDDDTEVVLVTMHIHILCIS